MNTIPKKLKISKKAQKHPLIWSDQHVKLYQRLFNHLENNKPELNAKFDNYIETHKRMLASFIMTELNLGKSSQEALLFMVSRYLSMKHEGDRYIKIYQQHGYDLMESVRNDEKENKQSESELVNYRPLEYFEQILNDLSQDHLLNNQQMLLAMVTYQPTIRTSFYNSAMIITKLSQNNNINNFIRFEKKTHRIYYIVNDDKVKNHRGYQNNQHSTIEVKNVILKNHMWQYFNVNQDKKYYFQNTDDDAYEDSTLRR